MRKENSSEKLKLLIIKKYITAENLTKSISDNAVFNEGNNTINIDNGLIRLLPGSFFIYYSYEKDFAIAQMPLPIIKYGSSVYIPADCIVNALNTMKIFDDPDIDNFKKINIASKTIQDDVQDDDIEWIDKNNTIDEKSEQVNKVEDKRTLSEFGQQFNIIGGFVLNSYDTHKEDINDGKNDEENIENNVVIPEKSDKPTFPPNVYVLPKNLIRPNIK